MYSYGVRFVKMDRKVISTGDSIWMWFVMAYRCTRRIIGKGNTDIYVYVYVYVYVCMLSLHRAIDSACVAGVISIMVGDDQRVDNRGRSCTTGMHYGPYDTCSSSHNQCTGST